MVLSFKPEFKEKILRGTKVHSIRLDPKKRWKRLNIIHMATGVRTKDYNCFAEEICENVTHIKLNPITRRIEFERFDKWLTLNPGYNFEFANNDGFDNENDFWDFFNEPFTGVLIQWTPYYYHTGWFL